MSHLLFARGRCVATLFAMVFLSSCATSPTAPSRETVGDVAMLESWELRGKLGLRTAEQAANLSFRWSQHPRGEFSLQLMGPLGVSVGSVEGQLLAEGSRKRDWAVAEFDGNVIEGPIDSLLLPTLGYDVPLRSLYYWVRGLPDPSRPSTQIDSGFSQSDWIIRPTRSNQPLNLPSKINIRGSELSLRLAGLRWSL